MGVGVAWASVPSALIYPPRRLKRSWQPPPFDVVACVDSPRGALLLCLAAWPRVGHIDGYFCCLGETKCQAEGAKDRAMSAAKYAVQAASAAGAAGQQVTEIPWFQKSHSDW